MATLQIEVSEHLATRIGLDYLQKKLQKWLELQELQLAALDLKSQFSEAGISSDVFFEEGKAAVWQQFKREKLADILP
jgi:hypothetical protein